MTSFTVCSSNGQPILPLIPGSPKHQYHLLPGPSSKSLMMKQQSGSRHDNHSLCTQPQLSLDAHSLVKAKSFAYWTSFLGAGGREVLQRIRQRLELAAALA